MKQRPFSYAADAPAFMTPETMSALVEASKALHAKIARRRAALKAREASVAKTTAIRADIDAALQQINRGARVIAFPVVKS